VDIAVRKGGLESYSYGSGARGNMTDWPGD
jgi:hypothetical protein